MAEITQITRFDNVNTFFSGGAVYNGGGTGAIYQDARFDNVNTFFTGGSIYNGGGTGAIYQDARFDNTNQFFSGGVVGDTIAILPDRLDNANTFYSPTVSQSSPPITLTPSRLDNVNTFFTPTVTGGAQPPQIIGGHYVDWWVKKYNAQFKRDEPEELPTLEEVEEFVEEQPAQALEALRTVAPSVALGLTPALLAANERLIQSIADQLLIAIELRRIQLAEDDDIESILLML